MTAITKFNISAEREHRYNYSAASYEVNSVEMRYAHLKTEYCGNKLISKLSIETD